MKTKMMIFILGSFLMINLNSFARNYPTSVMEGTSTQTDTSLTLADTACCGDTALVNLSAIPTPDAPASFPGGDISLKNYVTKNIQYPTIARNQGIEGKLYAMITVDRNGKIENIQFLNQLGGGCEEEVLRVLANMPSWEPKKLAGEPVESYTIFSFTFKL